MRYPFLMSAVFGLVLAGCGTETTVEDTTSEPAETAAPDSSAQPAAGDTFALTGDNTQVLFTGTKQSGDSHSGGFKTLTGQIKLSDGSAESISVVIDTDSLYSDAERLTGHLKSEDFFSVPEFPEMKFESTQIEGAGEVTVTGNLTMHGQTQDISFPATIDVVDDQVSLNAEFKVDRSRFGMDYTGKPDDPINAEVDIRVIVGGDADAADDAAETAE